MNIRKFAKYAVLLLTLLGLSTILSMKQKKFGQHPSGSRLERIQHSPNYKNGAFANQSFTPDLTEGATYFSVMTTFLFKKSKRVKPMDRIPSVKTNLHQLNPAEDVLIWLGHSSYYLQADGKCMLVDPVLSGSASPVSFTTKAFPGADIYKPEDIPPIDFLFITHDHWDHLDYKTLMALQPRIKKVICGLGVGAHLELWGFNPAIITELDWEETVALDAGFTVHATPARHFSGRGLKRNQTLWVSFVLQTPHLQLFLGGDSGYDHHFATIGKKFGKFDLVILENGQYDKSWKYIHMDPEEVWKAAADLHAVRLLPVHSSKFAIANHDWDVPLITIKALQKNTGILLATPMIGASLNLNDTTQQFDNWWEGIR